MRAADRPVNSRSKSPTHPRRHARASRVVEFLLLFVAAPVAYAVAYRHGLGRGWLVPSPIPVLLVFSAGCLLVLLCDRTFPRRRLWNAELLGARLRRVLGLFLVLGGALAAAFLLLEPERFAQLVRRRPALWGVVMVAYPVLSVYPQELIYRAFFFHRYREVFPTTGALVLMAALAFGLAHLVFWNWVGVVLSTLGGWLFARRYARTESLLVTSVEHALYGDLIFTVGLGWYFYHGTLRTLGN
jgi:hypothetical protein